MKDFFVSTKGQEWSRYSSWGDPMEHPCNWYGVECDENRVVIGLNLANNGLGGLLSSSIGELSSLKTLDISDNDIKGSIPKELFKLSKLMSLRLRLVVVPLLLTFVTFHAHITYALSATTSFLERCLFS